MVRPLENVTVPGMVVLLNWLTVVDKALPDKFVPYVITEDGRWLKKNTGAYFTFTVKVAVAGKYRTVSVGKNRQKMVNGPRTSNNEDAVNTAPAILFLLKVNVPARATVIPLITDSIVEYASTWVTVGNVIVGAVCPNTVSEEDAEETV